MVVFTSLQPKGKDQQGGYQTCHDLSQSQLSISKMPHPPQPRRLQTHRRDKYHSSPASIRSPHAASQPMTQLPFPPRTALFTPVYSGQSSRGILSCPPVQTLAASHTPLLPWLRPTSPTDGYSCTHTFPAPSPCPWHSVCSHSLNSTWLILESRSDHRLSAQDPGMVSHLACGRCPRPHRAPEAPSRSAPLPLCTLLLLHASPHSHLRALRLGAPIPARNDLLASWHQLPVFVRGHPPIDPHSSLLPPPRLLPCTLCWFSPEPSSPPDKLDDLLVHYVTCTSQNAGSMKSRVCDLF